MMQVGVIGLGAMGKAVAANLLGAGFATMVWNRSPAAADDLVARGAARAADVADVLRCDVILSLLFDDRAVRQVFLDSGVLAAAAPGATHVCMSTISTALAADLVAAHGAHGLGYVAAPVLGRPDAAAAAQLNILAAGEAGLLQRVAPVFAVLGRTWRMGQDPRHGHLAKIAGNFMLASAAETMLESAALIRSHGGDPAAFLTMMSETLLAAPVYKLLAPPIGAGRFVRPPEVKQIALKDIGLTLAEGAASGTPVPFADVLHAQLSR